MSQTEAVATYRVRIATAGATVVTGNVALTLTPIDFAETPIISGPSVDLIAATTTSHPLRVRCIVDSVLFTSSGRMQALGRLVDIQRDLDGGGYSTIATGRVSHFAETDGRGLVDLEISDERWVERRSELFRTTSSVQLHPPGLASAWQDRPAAGTTTYTVAAVSGNAVLIYPGTGGESNAAEYYVPSSLRQSLTRDLKRLDVAGGAFLATNSAGNFNSLRFEYSGGDRTIIMFRELLTGVQVSSTASGPLGPLAPDGTGIMQAAWFYMVGHGLSATNEITGRFYFSTGIETTEEVPVHIGGANGIHPMTLLKDVLDGDYGGQPVLYDSTTMTALEALSFRKVWARIPRRAERSEWLAASIYQVYGLAPLIGTDLLLRPTLLRIDQNLNTAGLTTLDATNSRLLSWEHSSRELVNVLDVVSAAPTRRSGVSLRTDEWGVDGMEPGEVRGYWEHDNVGTIGYVAKEVRTDLIFERWDRRYLDDALGEVADEWFNVFGDGLMGGTIEVADDAGVEVGDFVIIDHASHQLWNAGTDARTSERLALLVGFTESRPDSVVFAYLDLGANSAALSAPTVSIAQSSAEDFVDVTISGLAAGTTAVVECTHDTTTPTEYDYVRSGVGNETIQFQLDAASGTAYTRAKAVAPGRIASAWATDSVSLSSRPRIDAAEAWKGATAVDIEWTVPSGTNGIRTDYDIHVRGTQPTFGSNQADYAASAGGFTISSVSGRAQVSVQLTPYPTWTGSAVSGTPGDPVVLTARFYTQLSGIPTINTINRLPRVRPGEVTFNADGEAVVSATGDEDNTDQIIVTVGNGSAPSDPTVATNDGVISGVTGTVDTGVKITTGSIAFVRMAAVDAAGEVGPVVQTQQARRLGAFHKDTSTRSHTGDTTETTLETISIPAGVLGTDGRLELDVFGLMSAATNTVTVRFKLNGGTMFSYVFNLITSAYFRLILSNDGGTSAQQFNATLIGDTTSGAIIDTWSGTDAEDSTSSMSLTITVQMADSSDLGRLDATYGALVGTD